MTNPHGNFVWYELATTDATAAETFYSAVIGWTARDAGAPGVAYTILYAGDVKVAGLMGMCQEAIEAGAKPGWTGYILTDGVDDYAARVKEAGGAVRYGPADIPGGIGRYAVAADPYGAPFVMFQPKAGEQAKRAAPGAPGSIGWHELHAGDGPGAFAFYSGLFGWTKTEAMDMGPRGVLSALRHRRRGGRRHDDEMR